MNDIISLNSSYGNDLKRQSAPIRRGSENHFAYCACELIGFFLIFFFRSINQMRNVNNSYVIIVGTHVFRRFVELSTLTLSHGDFHFSLRRNDARLQFNQIRFVRGIALPDDRVTRR